MRVCQDARHLLKFSQTQCPALLEIGIYTLALLHVTEGWLTNTLSDLEMLLLRYRALEKPSAALRERGGDDEEDEDEEAEDGRGRGDDIGMVNVKGSGIRSGGGIGTGKSSTGIRGGGRGKGEDSDSDFDL